jgi:CO/xanthine dehydrogenase Mo-binding subunit
MVQSGHPVEPRAQPIALGSYLSQVAEVAVDEKGNVRVERIVCAVDCGLPVNPKMIDAQIQSGTIFGLTAALRGAITIKDGRVEQGNFDSYPPLRIDETPPIETHIVASTADLAAWAKRLQPLWPPRSQMPFSRRQSAASEGCRYSRPKSNA